MRRGRVLPGIIALAVIAGGLLALLADWQPIIGAAAIAAAITAAAITDPQAP